MKNLFVFLVLFSFLFPYYSYSQTIIRNMWNSPDSAWAAKEKNECIYYIPKYLGKKNLNKIDGKVIKEFITEKDAIVGMETKDGEKFVVLEKNTKLREKGGVPRWHDMCGNPIFYFKYFEVEEIPKKEEPKTEEIVQEIQKEEKPAIPLFAAPMIIPKKKYSPPIREEEKEEVGSSSVGLIVIAVIVGTGLYLGLRKNHGTTIQNHIDSTPNGPEVTTTPTGPGVTTGRLDNNYSFGFSIPVK